MLFPHDLTIETARCRLRCVAEDDIPHIFSATRYAGFTDGMLWEPPREMAELYAPYYRALASWDEGTSYCFTVEKKDDSAFIGRIAIRKSPGEDAVWDLGFWTHPEQQRKGYMTEAASAMVQFGFSRLQAVRIEACHALWNVASEKVLMKIGMRFQRHIPLGFQKHGQWVDENLLAITEV